MMGVQAKGPWVLVDPEPPENTTEGGIYLPDGNLLERLGHVVARVKSVGKGYYEKDKRGKERFIPAEIKSGQRVVFRGHLKDANKVGGDGLCFLHMKDLVGILSDDAKLTLALPYDN